MRAAGRTALRAALVAIAALAALGACARGGAEATPAAASVAGVAPFEGRWSTDGTTLPPLSLELLQDGSALRGRAFLSGVTFPVEGTATGPALLLRSTEEPAREISGALGTDGVLRARLTAGRSVVRFELRRE